MLTKKKTFSINKNVIEEFEKNCFNLTINQSLLITRLIALYNLKGNNLFNDILWTNDGYAIHKI